MTSSHSKMSDVPFLNIGVTGHRRFDDKQRIVAGIDCALLHVRQAYPDRNLCILSPLAEGADRLVVRRATSEHAARYVVPLPLPVDDFLTDFHAQVSKREFLSHDR